MESLEVAPSDFPQAFARMDSARAASAPDGKAGLETLEPRVNPRCDYFTSPQRAEIGQ
jgi:hypothetical protein